MPTNLPPEALEAERRYRQAESNEERIDALQEFIGLIPKHRAPITCARGFAGASPRSWPRRAPKRGAAGRPLPIA